VPPPANEVRFPISDDTDLDRAIEQVRSLVMADRRVLADPAPSVLLDRSAAQNALEIVVAFSTEDGAPLVKSDLIKAVHEALEAQRSEQVAQPV
jgi:small-conductance mechanosensitive channel